MTRKFFAQRSDNCVNSAFLSGATSTTDPVSMGVDISCDIVVDDGTNVWDV